MPACVAGLLALATAAGATELRIRVAPARIEQAELLVVAWGAADRITLETDFDTSGNAFVRLPLDDEWIKARWAARFPDMMAAYVYLQLGDGFVPIRSERFIWAGIPDKPDGPPAAAFTFDFGRNQRITVRPGETREIALTPRRRAARQLRFVDEDDRPVDDIAVSAYMFWSMSNHCGVLSGADPLVRRVRPNASGIVTLPDGDFEYAVEVEGSWMRVVDPPANDYNVFTGRLTTPERVVRIHRMRRQPLSMLITVGSAPAKHAPLTATASRCGCGTCTGMVAMSGDDGRLRVEEFYPEAHQAICIADDLGDSIWRLSPADLNGRPLVVHLPAGTKPGIATFCEPPMTAPSR